MSTSTPLRVLVLLSTGKQGTAVVSQLSASSDPSFQILAVTRNAQSDAGKRLSGLPNVSVIQGSTATPTSTDDLFAKTGPLDGLVIIQLDADEHPGGSEGEIEEAKRIINTAKRHGVKHIVYHGMDLPSTIKHPVQDYVKPKIEIPDYLASKSDGGKAYTWTVLRPCNFFENFIVPGHTAFMITFLTQVENKPMQFISIKDIAFFSALSLSYPARYHGQKISLAGDLVDRIRFEVEWKAHGLPEHLLTDVLVQDVEAVIKGKPLEGLVKFINEEMNGEQVDVQQLRKIRPGLATLSSFLRENQEYILSIPA